MDKDKLVELAERCEAATGPDRELDALIYAEQLGEVEWVGNTLRAAGVNLGAIDPGKHQRNFTLWYQRTPDYTASLDAAMTLVPKGWGFAIGEYVTPRRRPFARTFPGMCHFANPLSTGLIEFALSAQRRGPIVREWLHFIASIWTTAGTSTPPRQTTSIYATAL